MTHPAKWAPPGWIDLVPFETALREAEIELAFWSHELAALESRRPGLGRNWRWMLRHELLETTRHLREAKLTLRRARAAWARAVKDQEGLP